MSLDLARRREEIFMLEPELRTWAAAYTEDTNLAYALVHHTILKSWRRLPLAPDTRSTRRWLAEVMWQTVSDMDCFENVHSPVYVH
jgi:DNA-directed RNA polymerase specialized sigma24 family protein